MEPSLQMWRAANPAIHGAELNTPLKLIAVLCAELNTYSFFTETMFPDQSDFDYGKIYKCTN